MTLFSGRYRIESARMKNWDYGTPGFYFITICTKDRLCYFGKIEIQKMKCSEIGQIAKQYWLEIPVHFTNVHLDEFQIMPNHIHGIIKIAHKTDNHARCVKWCGWGNDECVDGERRDGGRDKALPHLYHHYQMPEPLGNQNRPGQSQMSNALEIQNPYREQNLAVLSDIKSNTNDKYWNDKKIQMSRISPKPGTLPVIIGSYKSIVTRKARQKYFRSGFGWQDRYYDHIIRNDKELNSIRRYIKLNPLNWRKDQTKT